MDKIEKIAALAQIIGVDVDPIVLLRKLTDNRALTPIEARLYRAMRLLEEDVIVNPSPLPRFSIWNDPTIRHY